MTVRDVLIVSPHLDDAVLSCFALLTAEAPADVVSVFAGRPDPPRVAWSERVMGFPDSDATMAARHAENERALAGLARTAEALDLLDEDYIDGPRPAASMAPVAAYVVEWLAAHPGGRVAAPAGAGRVAGRVRARIERLVGPRGGVTPHPDHVAVRDAVLALLADGALRELTLYEELPYLWSGDTRRTAERLAARAGRRVTAWEQPVDRSAKAQRIALYASQLEHLAIDGRRLEDPSVLPPIERYFSLA